MVVASGQDPPKQAENENPPNHHNDEHRDDALREILIFRHCLVPLTGICASNPEPGPPPTPSPLPVEMEPVGTIRSWITRSDDAPLPDQTRLGKFAVHPEQIGTWPFPAAYNLCAWGPGWAHGKTD